jgi:pimeloyl-ACP methyl ester carboxylesterase
MALRCAYPGLAFLNQLVLKRLFGNPALMTEEIASGYAAPVSIPGTADHVLGIASTWHSDMHELEEALPRIAHIPVLLVWGDRDSAVPMQTAEALRHQWLHAELAVLRGVGHLPYEEAPEDFNRLVNSFLGS